MSSTRFFVSPIKNSLKSLFKVSDRFRNSGPVKVFGLKVKAKMCEFDDWVYDRSTNEIIPLPPPLLRYRVHGELEAPGFLWVGNNCANNLKDLLNSVNREIYSFANILDFGCGCGRVLSFFHDHPDTCHFYGTGIDPEAI